jgi:hypothetical protein
VWRRYLFYELVKQLVIVISEVIYEPFWTLTINKSQTFNLVTAWLAVIVFFGAGLLFAWSCINSCSFCHAYFRFVNRNHNPIYITISKTHMYSLKPYISCTPSNLINGHVYISSYENLQLCRYTSNLVLYLLLELLLVLMLSPFTLLRKGQMCSRATYSV